MFRIAVIALFTGSLANAGNIELIFEDDFELSPDDRYAGIGNTQLLVGAPLVTTPHVFVPGNVLENDAPLFQGGNLTVQSFDSISVEGGDISMAPDGTFSYQPPAGFVGTDRFGYIATNGTATIDALVTVALTERVWYVDGEAAGGNGTSSQPFNTISPISGAGFADADEEGDFIYLAAAQSAYPGGIELEPMQHLIGEGSDLVVNDLTLAPMGDRPLLSNAGGVGVILANGVTLDGFDIQGTADDGIQGTDLNQPVTISGISISDTGGAGFRLQEISGTFSVAESSVVNSVDSGVVIENATGPINFFESDVSNTGLHGYEIRNASDMTIDGRLIGDTVADGINVLDSNILITFMRIGEQGTIGDDGIEINNTTGAHTASIFFNNVFGLGVADPQDRGLEINVSGGSLNAVLEANFFATINENVYSTDSGVAGSLTLAMVGNSTLSSFNKGVFTMDFVGSGLHSTIVREWESPNQVIGGITMASGIAFRRVTFDSDADPSNGFQQVVFDNGDLDIGHVPPFTIQRVNGDGLRFDEPAGSLRIGQLNIANDGGFGLFVDPASSGSFQLEIDNQVIDTINGSPTNF